MKEHLVDARGLEPPEPLELTIAGLETLQPAQKLRLLIHRDPTMLYSILCGWGYTWHTEARNDGTFDILIWQEQPDSLH